MPTGQRSVTQKLIDDIVKTLSERTPCYVTQDDFDPFARGYTKFPVIFISHEADTPVGIETSRTILAELNVELTLWINDADPKRELNRMIQIVDNAMQNDIMRSTDAILTIWEGTGAPTIIPKNIATVTMTYAIQYEFIAGER